MHGGSHFVPVRISIVRPLPPPLSLFAIYHSAQALPTLAVMVAQEDPFVVLEEGKAPRGYDVDLWEKVAKNVPPSHSL